MNWLTMGLLQSEKFGAEIQSASRAQQRDAKAHTTEYRKPLQCFGFQCLCWRIAGKLLEPMKSFATSVAETRPRPCLQFISGKFREKLENGFAVVSWGPLAVVPVVTKWGAGSGPFQRVRRIY